MESTLPEMLQAGLLVDTTYVYISTDSVYEVCETCAASSVREIDAVRPADQRLRRRKIKKDKYGDGKLSVEEYIERFRSGLPSVRFFSLRLADVIGPYENTGRLWSLVLGLAKSDRIPFTIPVGKRALQPLNFTFSHDVSACIARLLEEPALPSCALNVACAETVSYAQLCAIVSSRLRSLGLLEGPPQFREGRGTLFPSVTRASPLCMDRLYALGVTPTPLREAVEQSAEWFAECTGRGLYQREFAHIVAGLERSLASAVWNDVKLHPNRCGTGRVTPVPSSSSSSSDDSSSSDASDADGSLAAADVQCLPR